MVLAKSYPPTFIARMVNFAAFLVDEARGIPNCGRR